MKSMDQSDLVTFLNTYGTPKWENSFQKRDSDIKITSIPMIIGDSITGIIKVFEPENDSIRVDFFPVWEIDQAILETLPTNKFHIYRGAVQSLIISSKLLNIDIDNRYLNWLKQNESRIEERVRWHCIETWDCQLRKVITGTTWTSNTSYIVNYSIVENCKLLHRECWTDYAPRNFPSNWIGTGNNTNNNTNNGSSGNENVAIRNIKTSFLKGLLEYNNLGEEYFDLLYICVSFLPVPNQTIPLEEDAIISAACVESKLPCLNEANNFMNQNGLDLTYDEFEEFVGGFGNNCNTQTEFNEHILEELPCFNKASSALKSYISDLLKEDALVDPCDENNDTGDIIKEALGELCDKSNASVADFEEELEKGDYIYYDASFTPFMRCIYEKLLKSNSNLVCTELKKFNGPDFNLQFSISSGPLSGDADAETSLFNLGEHNTIDVVFNPDYVNGTCDVFLMKTMIHETIHASIEAAIQKCSDLQLEIFYPGLGAFIDQYGSEQGQHEYMAKFKREEMKNILKEIFGNSYSDEEYDMMVWSGLHETYQFVSNADYNTIAERNAFRDSVFNLQQNCDDLLCQK